MATATESRPASAAAPKIRKTQLLIDGEWRDSVSGNTFATINPATEEKIADVAEGTAEDVDIAVRAARRAFEDSDWSRMDARDRGRLLNRLADLIEENAEELAALETLDNGKPIRDSQAADVPLVIDCLRYYAGWADKIQGDTIPVRGEFFTYTRREPLGVCGQIIPWNFPMLMVAWKWGPALAAGCTIVMKPAEQTPLTCLRMGELAMEAGFPAGVINIVTGDGPNTGAAIVKHPDVDKIAFTGEHRTAQLIMKDAAQSLKRLTFELGRQEPERRLRRRRPRRGRRRRGVRAVLQPGAVLLRRQPVVCRRVGPPGVRREDHEPGVQPQALGDPFDPETTQGPQVDQAQFDKIMYFIDKGNEAGAKCLTGGKRFGERGYYVEPTVFDNVTDDMEIARDEIFGPVMNILPFSDASEIVERANNTYFGLAAAVWTRDVAKAHKFAAGVKAGTVWVNCYDVFDAGAPFGGFKMSGIGRELGAAALNNYTELKTVTVSLA